ncbi:MAG: LD-carboxypeptidase [Bacteroidales bacterium]|nr:LD-carboxypeptidase [Candidatus Liminaster caballi]
MHIRIISPAGNVKAKVVDAGVATLRSWGHKVTVAEHALGSYGRYSGYPEERVQDIVDALEDPTVDVLWATRGGYGCMQILDRIPLDIIRKAGKPIVGYSDITALHALWSKAGVQSVHAPMMKHLGDDPGHRTTKTLRELLDFYAAHNAWPQHHNRLFMAKAKIQPVDADGAPVSLDNGVALANADCPVFVGGNLSVLTGLHGTPFDYDYAGRILFIEDIAEQPYKIDRMLQQLRLMGVFGVLMPDGSVDKSGAVAGLVCGHFTDCPDDPSMPANIWDNIRWVLQPYQVPIWLGSPIGHELNNFPVIVG